MSTIKLNSASDPIHLLNFVETGHFEIVNKHLQYWAIALAAIAALTMVAVFDGHLPREESSPVTTAFLQPLTPDAPKIAPDVQDVVRSSDVVGQMRALGVQENVKRIAARADQIFREMGNK